MKRTVIAIFLSFFISGCASMMKESERSDFNQIQKDMAWQDVYKIMGQPKKIYSFGEEQALEWEYTSVHLSRGKVVAKMFEGIGYDIKIQALTGEAPKSRRARILSSVEGMDQNSLEFAEVKRLVGAMLTARGYSVTDGKEAEVAVFVHFGISDPITKTVQWTEPVYNYVPGNSQLASSTSSHQIQNQYGQNIGSIQSQTTYRQTPDYGHMAYAGERTRSFQKTTYVRHLILEAMDVPHYLKTKEMKPLWKVTARSEGASGDMRKVLPYLAQASIQFIEKDSGGLIDAFEQDGDPRVKVLLAPPNVRTPSSK